MQKIHCNISYILEKLPGRAVSVLYTASTQLWEVISTANSSCK